MDDVGGRGTREEDEEVEVVGMEREGMTVGVDL